MKEASSFQYFLYGGLSVEEGHEAMTSQRKDTRHPFSDQVMHWVNVSNILF